MSDPVRRTKRRRLLGADRTGDARHELADPGGAASPHAGSLRSGLTRPGGVYRMEEIRHLGDWCGQLGLNLPRHKQKVAGRSVAVYSPPPGGVSISDLEAAFVVPVGWSWAPYRGGVQQARLTGVWARGHLPGWASRHRGKPDWSLRSRHTRPSLEAPAMLSHESVSASPIPGSANRTGDDGRDHLRSSQSGGEAERPRRKPRRRKRVDEDLDLSDLDDLLPPSPRRIGRKPTCWPNCGRDRRASPID